MLPAIVSHCIKEERGVAIQCASPVSSRQLPDTEAIGAYLVGYQNCAVLILAGLQVFEAVCEQLVHAAHVGEHMRSQRNASPSHTHAAATRGQHELGTHELR